MSDLRPSIPKLGEEEKFRRITLSQQIEFQAPGPQTSEADSPAIHLLRSAEPEYALPVPKEYIHFRIAERAAALLARTRLGPDLAPAQPRCRAALLLGAVFHDALFYLETPGHREPATLLRLPHLLHGKEGNDTHGILRAQAAHTALLAHSDNGPLARAFLVGLVAHVQADVALHPLIYHLSGDYYNEPQAVERHRLLESCLDLSVAGSLRELRKRRLRELLRIISPVKLAPLDYLAVLAGCDTEDIARATRRAWSIFGCMQMLALSRMGNTLARLRPLLPSAWRLPRETLALCYPPAASVEPVLRFLALPIDHKQPVTGAPSTATIRELMEKAAQATMRSCLQLAPAAFGENDPALALDRGPHLDTGLTSPSTIEQTRSTYFATPRFPAL